MRRPSPRRVGAGSWIGCLLLLALLPGCSLFRKDVPTGPDVTAPESSPPGPAPAPPPARPKAANATRKAAPRPPEPAAAPADTAVVTIPEPPAPSVTVRMTPEQRSAREVQYREDVDRAGRALEVARACSLSPDQKEQLATADRFLADARDAHLADDLTRAGTLAQKARVLAEALRDAAAPR